MPPTRRGSIDRVRRIVRLRAYRRTSALAAIVLIGLMAAFVAMAFSNGPVAFTQTGAAGINEAPDSTEPLSQEEIQAEAEDLPLHLLRGEMIGAGAASFYGGDFAGRPTASGERFDPSGLTAAHRTLPIGSKVRVTNLRNGQAVVVRINDRGPFHGNRVIDLSQEAARQIGMIQRGVARVELELLPIRS